MRNIKINIPVILTEEQKQVLVGTVLGDGNLRKIINHYTGKLEQSHKQKDYLLWKHSLLLNLSSHIMESIRLDKRNNSTNHTLYFIFKGNLELKYFYELFYKDNKKYISKEIFQYLTPLAIAIWYMDDGTYGNYCCYLCTDCFEPEEVDLLREFFLEKYGIITSRNKRNRILFKAKTVNIFLDLIRPYIIPSMQYKLINKYKKSNCYVTGINGGSLEVDNPVPSMILNES